MVLRKSMGGDEALAPDLWLLERNIFDVDKYIRMKCPAMSEKGIKKLRSELSDLKTAFIDFSKKNVHAEYPNFIRATRDISGLETSLFRVRNLVSTQVAIIHGLLGAGDVIDAASSAKKEKTAEEEEEIEKPLYVQSEWEKRFISFLDSLEILLAERKIEEVLGALKEGEKLYAKHAEEEEEKAVELKATMTSLRAKLVEDLIEATKKPSVRGAELRSACSVLQRLGEGQRAHSLLLISHHTRLLHHLKSLRRSGTSYGGAYTAALSQLFFSAISQALKDSLTVFGEQLSYASELMMWARRMIEDFVVLLKKYVLSSAAAAGGLRAAGECVQIALGHCLLLEDQGLALSPYLSSLLKSSVELALSANLKRIGDSTLALAAADRWYVIHPSTDARIGRRSFYTKSDGVQLLLSNSAHMLYTMIEEFLGGVAPLISFQLANPMFEALSGVYEEYIRVLMNAMPVSDSDSVVAHVKPAETLSQQLVLIGNASALADEILPSVLTRLTYWQQNYGKKENPENIPGKIPEEEEWRKSLHQSFDKLKDMVVNKWATDVIYDRNENVRLGPETYSLAEDDEWENKPLPSLMFKELHGKVIMIRSSGENIVKGQEKVLIDVLRQLVEAIVCWILNNDKFWNEMEEGHNIFSSLGLRMFVLDMQFVMEIASDGHYASKMIYKVVAENIAHATNAFALNKGDPMRVLPDDKWFVEHSRLALHETYWV